MVGMIVLVDGYSLGSFSPELVFLDQKEGLIQRFSLVHQGPIASGQHR